MRGDSYPSYDSWKQAALKQCRIKTVTWNAIGLWMYPTKENPSFREVFAHLCKERREQNGQRQYDFNECKFCGEKVPDGFKMIALLEKL